MSEDKKVETTPIVVEEKETKKSKKSDEVVKADVKVEEPKKETKVAAAKKEFAVGVKVLDKAKDEFEIVSLPSGELHDHSKITLKDKAGNLNVQLKGKLQLV